MSHSQNFWKKVLLKLCVSFYILWHFLFISSEFKCDICNKAFGRNDGLLRHIKEIHENPKKCEFCGKYFGRQETLKQHISDVHEKNRNHKCNYCDQAFGHKGMYIIKLNLVTIINLLTLFRQLDSFFYYFF